MLHLHSFLCVFKKKKKQTLNCPTLDWSFDLQDSWKITHQSVCTPEGSYFWMWLFFSWDLSHLLMIPFMFTSLNHPRKLYSSSTLCHTSPCSLNCPNHTTCESDPKGDKCRVFPSLIIPMKNQTWAFYPHKILLPNILDWYLENKFWIFFSSKMADEKYFLFVSLCFGFHLNLKTFLK